MIVSTSAVLFRFGVVLVHLGGALGLVGAWLNAQGDPAGGADIGAGVAVFVGAGVFVIGLLAEVASLTIWAKYSRRGHMRTAR